jgi:hypothetical protein
MSTGGPLHIIDRLTAATFSSLDLAENRVRRFANQPVVQFATKLVRFGFVATTHLEAAFCLLAFGSLVFWFLLLR